MITEWDDLLIHQSISTLDHVSSSDTRWHNRHWFHLGDIEGEVLLGAGLGVYPNLNVMDGLTVACVEGAQHNVSVSRELGRDRYTKVGPLRVDIEQGLRNLHIALAPNDHNVSFDLNFIAGMPPFEEERHYQRYNGREVRNNARYNQAGRFEGTLTVDGKTWDITPDRFWGVRDRSWGLRPGQGEPVGNLTHKQRWEFMRRSGFGFYHYNPTQFPEYSLFYMLNESPDGTVNACDGGICFKYGSEREDEVLRITAVESEMEFIDDTPQFKSARLACTLADGSVKRYTVTPILPCYLGQGGGYGESDKWHGSYRGKLVVEGSKFDLTDAAVVDEMVYANDYFSEWRCDDGEVGYGQFEYVLGASDRLGFPKPD
jgi:hypothetical protein